jgi:hypothetical protein
MYRSPAYATVPCASGRRHALAFHEVGSPEPAKPRLLDRVRAAARLRHYSRRTEAAYVAWTRRDIFFHGKRHPAELGASEVTRFLSSLAIDDRVAASTQNQALGALLFRGQEPYRHDAGSMTEISARRPVLCDEISAELGCGIPRDSTNRRGPAHARPNGRTTRRSPRNLSEGHTALRCGASQVQGCYADRPNSRRILVRRTSEGE